MGGWLDIWLTFAGEETLAVGYQFMDLSVDVPREGGPLPRSERDGASSLLLGCFTCLFWPNFLDKCGHSCPF